MGGDRGADHMGWCGFGVRVSIIGGAGFGGNRWEYSGWRSVGFFAETLTEPPTHQKQLQIEL